MGLTKLSVNRPLTMLMIILALAVLGYRGFTLMQVDRFPPIDFPIVSVVVVYPGASPQDVETQIAKPIEDALSGIPGVDSVMSVSNESVGYVVVQFLESVNGNQAAIDVERQVATIKGQLPDDALEPSVIKADFNAIPIMNIILSGSQSQDTLFKLAQDTIKPSLQAVNGVASVSVAGGRDRIIAVNIDANKLTAYDLPISSINQTFAMNNLTIPIGTLESGRLKSSVRAEGSFQSLNEIGNMVLSGGYNPRGSGPSRAPAGSDTGGLVYVGDVATVQDTFEDTTVKQRYNGQDTVVISIVKSSDANVIEVADQVREKIDSLNAALPGDTQAVIVSDDSDFIKNSVNSVEEDLMLAILITGLVMLAFLHTLRSTFIVILAIPSSLMATFLVMWVLGYSLNVLTLLALTLIIGVLVDDSIVVLENIERHLKMKKSPMQAAIDGRSEIGWAAIAITLVDVVVYVPVAFTNGIVGQFFRSYGITIATATLFSLFMSFTLTPMLAAYWMKDERIEELPRTGIVGLLGKLLSPIGWVWGKFVIVWDKGFDFLSNLYAKVIRISLHNFWTQFGTLVIAFAVLGASLTLAPKINFEMMPHEDDGLLTVNVEMPPSTKLDVTDEVAREIEQIILREVPETVSILTRVGGSSGGASIFSGGGGGGSNKTSVFVQLVNKNNRVRPLQAVVNDLRPLMAQIPDATVTVDTSGFVAGMETGISLQVYGPDPDTLIDISKQVENIVRSMPDTVDVVNTDAVRAPETKIKLNRQQMSDLGLSAAQVGSALRTAVTGSNVGDYAPDDEDAVSIVLRLDENSRQNLDKLLQLPIGYLNGTPIILGQVASIERTLAPSVINRYNRQRILTIKSGVTTANAGGVANEVESRIKDEITFPPEYGYQFSGATQEQRKAFSQLFSAIFMSVLLVYMLLVALYQDWLQPFAIIFTLPMALVGVFGGLYLTHNTFNMFSLLGVIMLFGVVTRNAILIVDFANQQQEQGKDRKESLIEAGRLRLRPIAMTANTLVFALLPVLFSTADGSESRTPLAAVMVGGAITAGFMALLVTPVMYNILESFSDWVRRITRKLSGVQSLPTTKESEA